MRVHALRSFGADSAGAVSSDWVVLTSLAVIAGVATISYILGQEGGIANLVQSMTAEVDQVGRNLQGAVAPVTQQ